MTYDTIDYRDNQIEIFYDENAISPREDAEPLGTMVCFHNRYNLGDEHNFDIEETKELFKDKKNIALPLFVYEHGGITMNTGGFSCPWDSGQVGIIYITLEKVRKEFGWKNITKARREQIVSYLKDEVETYDNYLTGDVFGYQVMDFDGESFDSCWGFYGDDMRENGLLEYAENAIDCQLAKEKKAEEEALILLKFLTKKF